MIPYSGNFNPVAITGMGSISAAGANIDQLQSNLYSGLGQPTISAKVRSDLPLQYPMFEIPDPWLPVGYNDSLQCTHCGLLAIEAATQALNHANLNPDTLKNLRVGICIGTTVGNAMNNETFYTHFLKDQNPPTDSITQYLQSNPADMIADHFSITGPRQCIANACSSGAIAIGQAAEWINSGLCDIVIAGGSDMLCRVIYNGFISLKITDDTPCKPFDLNRKGLNLGEAAGIVILESDASIKNRNAQKLSTLCSFGNCSDSYHLSAPAPDGKGLELAINASLAQANITHDDIAYINAHGTATPENDKTEGKLFAKLFPNTPFNSTKGYTGHTLGAAGALEAIITIIALQKQMIAASKGFQTPDPEVVSTPVTQNTEIIGDYALSDSVAFGGNNASLIFKRES